MINDIDRHAVASFSDRVRPFLTSDITLREASTQELVELADIVCTCTSIGVGDGPLFEDRRTKPWLHVNAVGADLPGKTELPRGLLKRSLVIPDFREQAEKEGECQVLESQEIGPDLATMMQTDDGNLDGRHRSTVFDSTGYALEDQTMMHLLLDLADEYGLGSEIWLEALSGDPLNPYDLARPTSRVMPRLAQN